MRFFDRPAYTASLDEVSRTWSLSRQSSKAFYRNSDTSYWNKFPLSMQRDVSEMNIAGHGVPLASFFGISDSGMARVASRTF